MNFNLKPESINYLKIFYIDDSNFLRCAKASIKDITECDIHACVRKEVSEKIPFPQDVALSFALDSGLYKGKSVLKYTNYEEPYLHFYIKIPQDVEYHQEREYFRVNLEKDVVISFKEGNELRKVACKTHDLSANGLKVKLNTKVIFPEEVFIDLFFDNREIRTKSRFIRSDEEDGIIKASFCFIEPAQLDVDYLSQVCIKKQIEDKRSSLE